jgi:enoyl-CoA hydratase/carnithine racemase
MSDYTTFSRSDRHGVSVIPFDHPPINLLDRELLIDLLKLAKALEADTTTRVVIFRSANPEFFIAHFDLGSQLTHPGAASGLDRGITTLCRRHGRQPVRERGLKARARAIEVGFDFEKRLGHHLGTL